MRQLLIQVPRGCGKQVLETVKAFDGANLALFEAMGSDGAIDLAIIHLSNKKVEGLLGELESLPQMHVYAHPAGSNGATATTRRSSKASHECRTRSPIEIFLAGLQSVDSWKGFIGYAAAGVVV